MKPTPEQQAAIDEVKAYLTNSLAGAGKQRSEEVAVLYLIQNTGTETIYHPDKGYSTVEVTGENSAPLVELAKDDPCAWEAAKRLSGVLLKENRLTCEELRVFAAEVLTGEFPKPKAKHAWGNILRDFPIAMAIHTLQHKANIPPYKNDVSNHTNSGIEIVAELVTKLGISINPRNCKGIWERWGPHIRATKKGGPYYFQSEGAELLFRKSNVPKNG